MDSKGSGDQAWGNARREKNSLLPTASQGVAWSGKALAQDVEAGGSQPLAPTPFRSVKSTSCNETCVFLLPVGGQSLTD